MNYKKRKWEKKNKNIRCQEIQTKRMERPFQKEWNVDIEFHRWQAAWIFIPSKAWKGGREKKMPMILFFWTKGNTIRWRTWFRGLNSSNIHPTVNRKKKKAVEQRCKDVNKVINYKWGVIFILLNEKRAKKHTQEERDWGKSKKTPTVAIPF
jgi:hypothetical protein